jgi:hypothetical protein
MNSKVLFLLAGIFAILLFISPAESFSQIKQRFVLKPGRGESGKAVAGRVRATVTGAAYRDYFFTIPKGRSADISVSTDAGEEVRFDVISPKGKKIFENTSDILDELPIRGTYVVRVYRNKDATDKSGASKFQLGIFMYI